MSTKLTTEERIKRFIMKHKEVDQTYFPTILIYWKTKDRKSKKESYMFYDLTHGKLNSDIRKDFYFTAKSRVGSAPRYIVTNEKSKLHDSHSCFLGYSGQFIKALYIKEDKALKVMEVSQCVIDTHRYNKDLYPVKRLWKRNENTTTAYFVNGEKIPYDSNGNRIERFVAYKKIWGEGYRAYNCDASEWSRFLTHDFYLQKSGRAFSHFARKTLVREKGIYIDPFAYYAFDIWFNYCLPIRRSGKKADFVKGLNDIADITNLDSILLNNSLDINPTIIIKAERINEEWLVFRYAAIQKEVGIVETYRVFISNKNQVCAARWGRNEWCSCPIRKENYWTPWGSKIIEGTDALKTFPTTQHIYDIITENYETNNWVDKFIKFSKAPILERFMKSNYIGIAKELDRVDFLLEDEKLLAKVFGPIPKIKSTSLSMSCGLSKAQMSFFEQKLREYGPYLNQSYNYRNFEAVQKSVAVIKGMLGLPELYKISLEDFQKMFSMAFVIGKDYSFESKCIPVLNAMLPTADVKIRFWKRISKIASKTKVVLVPSAYRYGEPSYRGGIYHTWGVLSDICKLLADFPVAVRPEIDFKQWKVDADIERTHDSIIAFSNSQRELIAQERNKELQRKMEKIDKKRKDFEYEDEKFLIKLPSTPTEITNEGCMLHHCVGGYVQSHVSGKTTLFFLRNKNAPNTPFYTIEVRGVTDSEENRHPFVVQIHGFGNRWLGNNPEAVPFVMRWLRDKNIDCSDSILLCTATGYGSYGAKMIDKPII